MSIDNAIIGGTSTRLIEYVSERLSFCIEDVSVSSEELDSDPLEVLVRDASVAAADRGISLYLSLTADRASGVRVGAEMSGYVTVEPSYDDNVSGDRDKELGVLFSLPWTSPRMLDISKDLVDCDAPKNELIDVAELNILIFSLDEVLGLRYVALVTFLLDRLFRNTGMFKYGC